MEIFLNVFSQSYLGQFGYMSKTSADSMKAGGLVDLKSFQKSIT